MHKSEVIYDWNLEGHTVSPPLGMVELHDETLRDGIQSPSVQDPPIEAKFEVVRLLASLGVDSADVALPGAGPRALADAKAIVEVVRDEGLDLSVGLAGRTHPNDVAAIVEVTQATGVQTEAMLFLGTSPIRLFTEGWDEDRLESLTRQAMKLAVEGGVRPTFVTEDTVRSSPTTLRRLFTAAVEEGATRIVLCDTCGHATPPGVYNLVHWTADLLRGLGVRDTVALDWHGHNDRGLALPNTLAAIRAGVDRVHGTVLGVGERVGNASLDQLLVNLHLMGAHDGDLRRLGELVDRVSEACAVPVPVGYPVFGKDAFRTGTGVHAAAVIKALRKGDAWLADRVYSGVPAAQFGREQQIEIGHQSGLSNVRFWLAKRGYPDTDEVAKAVFDHAKATDRVLSDDEIEAFLAQQGVQPAAATP